ncbi:MAG: hypothetical protein MZV70_18180 [Desulfobacterales bacterium]|nr:hypothetical protein [Desulfobacterales bacterium]
MRVPRAEKLQRVLQAVFKRRPGAGRYIRGPGCHRQRHGGEPPAGWRDGRQRDDRQCQPGRPARTTWP